jgi:aspartate-semialdehyde dehydrogenase
MKKRVAVVGATGIAGQQFLVALCNHPWFAVSALAASERSAGKSYAGSHSRPENGRQTLVVSGKNRAAQALAFPSGSVVAQSERDRSGLLRSRV